MKHPRGMIHRSMNEWNVKVGGEIEPMYEASLPPTHCENKAVRT